MLRASKSRDGHDCIYNTVEIKIAASQIYTNSIVGCGKSNLASNDAENIDLPIVLFQSLLHF